MEQHKATLLGVVIAVAAGVAGFNVISGGVFADDAPSTMANDGSFLTGHVTYTVYDKDGNIKAYQQTDNTVTRIGIDCTISFLFNNATVDGAGGATEQCNPSPGYTGFSFIAIGNETGAVAAIASQTALELDMTGLNGNVRIQDTSVAFTTAVANTQDTASVIIETPSTFTFTELATAGTTVTESGLFDAATGGNMFARQIFSTAVTNTDSLSVKWTVTIT